MAQNGEQRSQERQVHGGVRRETMKISVIIPVYNEGESVDIAYKAVSEVLRADIDGADWEILFVDDGSVDDSFDRVRGLAESDEHVVGLRLTSNCGTHMAIRAGLDHATGDVACFLACDLQEPPSLIPKLLEKLGGKVQIVAAARIKRDDPLLTRFFAWLFNMLARWIVSRDMPPGGASMYLLGPKALKLIRQYRERNLTLEGFFVTTGLGQTSVDYERRARVHGETKWTYSRRLKLFADFFVAHSYTPIRALSLIGASVAVIGFAGAVYFILRKLVFARPLEGWTSLMVVMLVLAGIQMFMLGVIGEYLWRTLDETRGRPNYSVDEFVNVADSSEDNG